MQSDSCPTPSATSKKSCLVYRVKVEESGFGGRLYVQGRWRLIAVLGHLLLRADAPISVDSVMMTQDELDSMQRRDIQHL